MHFKTIATAICLFLLSLHVCRADDFDPTAHAKAVERYVDNDVIAVGHVDLAKLNVAASLDWLVDDGQQPEMAVAGKAADAFVQTITKAGVRHVYVIMTLTDIPTPGPFLIATLEQDANADTVVGTLRFLKMLGLFQVCEKLGGAIYLGPKQTLTRLRTMKAKRRPEIAAAFAAAGDSTAQLLLVFSDEHRRVIREMLPRVPAEIGGGSGEDLANGLQWVAVSLKTPPKPIIKVISQGKDSQSAGAVRNFVIGTLTQLGQLREMKNLVQELKVFADVAKMSKVDGDQLVLELAEGNGLDLLRTAIAPAVAKAREQNDRQRCFKHLKQLGLALHNYHDRHKQFPATASYDKNGKPLLSWRVHLLPYIEQLALYKQFHLDEPWDSEHNRKLIGKLPEVFICPSNDQRAQGMTTYLAPHGKGLAFEGKEGLKFKEITDGASQTILLVEVNPEQAVIWTKPQDLEVDLNKPMRGLGNAHDKGFATLFCDGSARFFPKTIELKTLRHYFTRNGGEVP